MASLGLIGAAGTLGQATTRALLDAEPSLRINALVRQPDPGLNGLNNCNVIAGGLFDSAALDELISSSDVIVNLAARNPAGQASDLGELEQFLLVNALGAPLVARAAAGQDKPLLHFSTVAVYEVGEYRTGQPLTESETLPAGDQATTDCYQRLLAMLSNQLDGLTEASEADESIGAALIEPIRQHLRRHTYPTHASVYGLSKLLGEQLSLRSSDRVCAVRMSDVYGPGHESRGVMVDHLKALREQSRVAVDFDFRRSIAFIYIGDVTTVIRSLCQRLLESAALPPVLNLVGAAIDETAFQTRLSELARSLKMDCAVTVALPNKPKFDRRYADQLLRDTLPNLEPTPIADGLVQTWLNLPSRE